MSKDFFNTNFSGLDWYMLMGPDGQDLTRQREMERESRSRKRRVARWFSGR